MTSSTRPQHLSLHDLCMEIIAFRRDILDRRANLASPGYHLDLDGAMAAATTQFLRTLPLRCFSLTEKIIAYQLATGSDKFMPALDSLRILHDKPQVIFSLKARTLYGHFFVSVEFLKDIAKAQEATCHFLGGEI